MTMERKGIPVAAMVIIAGMFLACPQPARADDSCAVGFKPDTSGFLLNPILDKLTVISVKPATPKDVCVLRIHDEILQVNQQPVPGARALAVMKYWKSLKDGAPITFRVRRAGSVLTLMTK